jgi:hypothetical protein
MLVGTIIDAMKTLKRSGLTHVEGAPNRSQFRCSYLLNQNGVRHEGDLIGWCFTGLQENRQPISQVRRNDLPQIHSSCSVPLSCQMMGKELCESCIFSDAITFFVGVVTLSSSLCRYAVPSGPQSGRRELVTKTFATINASWLVMEQIFYYLAKSP